MMPTLAQKIFKSKKQKGFTLLEVLVALLVVSLVFFFATSSDSSLEHKKLQDTVNDIDRAVRFAANEAVLRNTITRLRFNFEEEPLKYLVEYGPKGNLVLPDTGEESKMSVKESEQKEKQKKMLDGQFTQVEEFAEITRQIPDVVTILGIGSQYRKKLLNSEKISLYFYPSGERDEAIIFFATKSEIAVLEIEAFNLKTKANYIVNPQGQEGRLEDYQEARIEEYFKEWLK